MIWKSPPSLDALNDLGRGCLIEHLGIVFTDAGDDWLCGTMPVDERTRQPYGLLHGGASVALAETLGSVAAQLVIGPDVPCVGLDINANHIRGVRAGRIEGRATARHLGRTTQVWQIDIVEEAGRRRLVCTSRITISILEPPERRS